MTALIGFDKYQPDAIPRVDLSVVLEAAQECAEALTSTHAVEVAIEPGDSTSYRLVLASPARFVDASNPAYPSYRAVGPGELLVTLMTPSVGVCIWGPGNSLWTDWVYVAEHWGLESEWTARVLSAFLNMLRDELAVTE